MLWNDAGEHAATDPEPQCRCRHGTVPDISLLLRTSKCRTAGYLVTSGPPSSRLKQTLDQTDQHRNSLRTLGQRDETFVLAPAPEPETRHEESSVGQCHPR